MTKTEVRETVLKLPVEERLELAESLWESIERDAEELPFHDWQKRLLDERLADAERNPNAWLSWDEVKERVLSSLAHRPGA